MKLWPHQREAAQAWSEKAAVVPDVSGIVNLPTGCGKTEFGLHVVNGYHDAVGGRSLWLAHREELVEQPHDRWCQSFPDMRNEAGIVKADLDDCDAKRLIVASVQTLSNDRRLNRLLEVCKTSGPINLIVPDEAHHSTAPMYRKIFSAFPNVQRMGLTATPERTDRGNLGSIFKDGLVYRLTARRAIAEGLLVPYTDGVTKAVRGDAKTWKSRRIVIPELAPQKLKKAHKDLSEAELEALYNEAAIKAIAEATVLTVVEGRRPVVFTHSVKMAREVARAIDKRGVPCDFVHGETPLDRRREILRAFKARRLQALVNCMVLTEGWDDVGVTAVIVARPTRSRPLYIQMVGRGLRNYCVCANRLNGIPCSCAKDDCLIVDLVGVSDHGLVSADTITDYDPDGWDEPEVKKKRRESEPSLADSDPAALRLKNLLRAIAGEFNLSVNVDGDDRNGVRWLCVQEDDTYCMNAGQDHGAIMIQREDGADTWTCFVERRDNATALTRGASLEIAKIVGEEHARSLRILKLNDSNAEWRKREASPGLMEGLKKWRVVVPPGIRQGEASDLLTVTIARARRKKRVISDPTHSSIYEVI